MRNAKTRLHPLALSVHLAIAAIAMPSAAVAVPIYAGPGATMTITGTPYSESVQGKAAVWAAGSSVAPVPPELPIKHGSIVGDATVIGASKDGYGLLATSGGSITLSDSAISTSGANNVGVAAKGVAYDGALASVKLTDTTVDASGIRAIGAWARAGGSIEMDGGAIKIGSAGDNAVRAWETGVVVSKNQVLSTDGVGTAAINAADGGHITLIGSDTRATGADSYGLMAIGAGSQIDATGGRITTSGASGYGVIAVDGAEVTLTDGASASTSNTGGHGAIATGSGAVVAISGSTVNTTGDDSAAAGVMDGGLITLDADAKVQASGANSNALEVVGAGSRATSSGSTLTSTQAVGIVMAQGAAVDLVDTAVSGATHAVGFIANGSDPVTTPAVLTVSGGSLSSAGTAIQSQIITAQVTLAGGVAVTADNGEIARAKDASTLALTVRDTSLQGDLFAESGSALDLALDTGSSLEGAIFNGRAMSMVDGTSWLVTQSSDVASLAHAGQITFAAPTADDYKTLTVHGDYTGNAGTLAINTKLGDDASPTDKFIVEGNTGGTTSLHVNNTGGTGAYTTADGIQVVRVDGTSAGTFSLDGRVVAGANEYLLAQGGKANPADGDWYLRSEAPPPVVPDPVVPDPVTPDPTKPDPAAPVTPDPLKPDPAAPIAPVAPLYRPEPAAYLANQAASVGMFEHSMHDRMGEPNLGKHGDNGRSSAAWVRVVRNQMDGFTGEGQLDTGTDMSVLQIGGEIARLNADSRFHIGLMGGTGRADTEVTSTLLDWRARGKVIGCNLGVYGTWFADAKSTTGLYLDGWLQYGSYDNQVKGDLLAEERYGSSTWAASIEAGYAFALNDGDKTRYYIEPQAQAIFTDYSASKHRENNGTLIDDVDAGGLTTRLGVRFYGHATNTQQNIVQPFVTLNWWHDNERNRMSFNDTVLELQVPRDRYEAKLGLQAQLGGGWTGWGNLGLAYGARDYHDVTGQLGLNYRW